MGQKQPGTARHEDRQPALLSTIEKARAASAPGDVTGGEPAAGAGRLSGRQREGYGTDPSGSPAPRPEAPLRSPAPGPLPASGSAPAADGGAARGWLSVGLLFGLTDAAAAERLLGATPAPGRLAALIAVGAATGVVVAGLGWLVARLLRRPATPWAGFVAGAGALLAADLGLVRFAALGPVGGLLGLAVGGAVAAAGLRLGGRPARTRLIFGLLLVALLAIRSSPRKRAPVTAVPGAAGPSVVVVTVDGLRGGLPLDQVPPPMPVLERLFDEGIRYTRAFTPWASWQGGHRAVLAGVVPWTDTPEGLDLAATMGALGWRSAALPATADLAEDAVIMGGFAEVLRPGLPISGLEHTLAGAAIAGALAGRDPGPRSAAAGVRRALRWLEATPGPALVWLHLAEPRPPFQPPPPWDEAWYEGDRYAPGDGTLAAARARGEIPPEHADIHDPAWFTAAWTGELAAVDAALGTLVEGLAAMPAPPLLVVVGSAGMPLGAEGRWLDPSGLTAPPASEVALVLWWPGHLPAGARLGAPVSLVDIGPTVCALAAGTDGACPPAGRMLPRAVAGAGLRAAASTQGDDGVGARHEPLRSERISATGAREVWTGGAWVAAPDEAGP